MQNIKNGNCNDIKSSIKQYLSYSNIDIDPELKDMIQQLYESIMKDLCKNGNVDIKLLTNLVKDLYETMCYKKW